VESNNLQLFVTHRGRFHDRWFGLVEGDGVAFQQFDLVQQSSHPTIKAILQSPQYQAEVGREGHGCDVRRKELQVYRTREREEHACRNKRWLLLYSDTNTNTKYSDTNTRTIQHTRTIHDTNYSTHDIRLDTHDTRYSTHDTNYTATRTRKARTTHHSRPGSRSRGISAIFRGRPPRTWSSRFRAWPDLGPPTTLGGSAWIWIFPSFRRRKSEHLNSSAVFFISFCVVNARNIVRRRVF